MTEPMWALSAIEVAEAVRHREFSVAEVTEAHLSRTTLLNDRLGAFVQVTAERAYATAERIDKVRSGDEPELPLMGVPCPIKDLNPVAGIAMGAGSAAMAGYVPDADDDIVGWLEAAGTVTTGKTSTPEFGLPCYTEPEAAMPAVTPWDTTRMAGGSSGGAASAVASGMAPIAHASDGGGSIRIPASCCGLVGLKASRGRIGTGRFRQPGPGLSTDGVLSRTVADTAQALDVLARPTPGATYLAPQNGSGFVRAVSQAPRRLRIGLLTTPVIAEAEVAPVCRQAAEATAELLAQWGHQVDAAPVPFPVDRWAAFEAIWSVGAATIPLPPDREALLRPLTRWLREKGRRVSGVEYASALSALQALGGEIAQSWDGFDAILTPTLAQPPLPVGAIRDDDDPAGDFAAQTRFTPWTSVANLSGRPAVSLPLHTARVDGVELPIGVMFTGRFGEEALLLSLAGQLEAEHGWRHPFVTQMPV